MKISIPGTWGVPLRKSGRLLSVDAVRGTAMVFVAVSHISLYVAAYSKPWAALLKWAGFFATPNFLLMSGFACGYQLARAGTRGVARIVDRGLFVLLVGHVLVAGSLVYVATPGTAFEHIVITDTIGLLLCTAPLIRVLSIRQALLWGCAIFLTSSAIALTWQPDTRIGALLGNILFDIHDPAKREAGWLSPTIPYFGLFLLGSGCGKLIFRSRTERRDSTTYKTFMRLGAAGMVAALALNVGAHFARAFLLDAHLADSGWANLLLQSCDLRHKNPPSLAYALFYGGAGIALVGLIGSCAQREASLIVRAAQLPAVLGRASFVTYVSVQWLVDFVPFWIGFETWLTPIASAAYLVPVLLVTFAIARAWDGNDANRFLTLGLRHTPMSSSQRTASAAFVAIALGLNMLVLVEAPTLIPPKLGLLTSDPHRWQSTIESFDTHPGVTPPPRDGVVFVGSSSIRFWNLPRMFPQWEGRLINRGFGGSYLSDSVYYVDRLVIPYAPRVVVVYAGDNDLDAGVSPEHVARDFAQLEQRIHAALPHTRLVFISIKPGLARARNDGAIRAANEKVRAYCMSHPALSYLDIWRRMIGPDGQVRADLYQPDGIHLSEAGYEIWSNALRPVLEEELASPPRQ